MAATILATDSDSDFGYDLTLEDEEALFQIASSTDPNSAPRLTPLPSDPASAKIDSVPGRTESLAGDDVAPLSELAPAYELGRQEAGLGLAWSKHHKLDREAPRGLPTPASLQQVDLKYPDRERPLRCSSIIAETD